MIEIADICEPSGHQIKCVIMGMRNPMNSWDKSDSKSTISQCTILDNDTMYPCYDEDFEIGDNDKELMKKLVVAGDMHAKFARMLSVMCTINAPLYWWKEFDTYKVGTVRNSCSTMHKIHSKEFERDDFSYEHLDMFGIRHLDSTINLLNRNRDLYLETKDKYYWWQMIQTLPSNYNQKATVMLNYQTLRNIYQSRKEHKLDEWRTFCKVLEDLELAEELIIV